MANPPIIVGELTDVPAPGSEIDAQFHQEVAHRVVHRFASTTALNNWAAANGSLAFVTANGTHYQRVSGVWRAIAGTAYVDTKTNALQAELDATQADLAALTTASGKNALGLIARAYNAAAVTFGTSTTVIVSTTFTASSSRWYRITADVPRITAGAAQDVTIVIEDAAGTNYRLAIVSLAAGADHASIHIDHVISGISGSQTFRIAANTSTSTATIPIGTFNSSNAMITVEDLGAV